MKGKSYELDSELYQQDKKEDTMKKRIVSICLVVCLAISLSAPAAATNVVDSDASASYGLEDGTLVSLQKISKGKYTLTDESVAYTANNVKDTVYARSLHDGEMLKLQDGTYLGKAEESNYIQLDRIDVDVDHFDRNDSVFQEYDISPSVLDDVQEAISYAQENDNHELEISLYAINPDLTEYITYKGNKYRNTYEEVRDGSFKPIQTNGAGSRDMLNNARTFVLTAVGLASTTVNFVSTGISLLDFIKNQTGTNVNYGGSGDWCVTTMTYQKLIKHTSINRNSLWMEGCISQKLWIDQAVVLYYFTSFFKEPLTKYSKINKTKYSSRWNTCYDNTFSNWATGTVKDPNFTMPYNGVTWVFS